MSESLQIRVFENKQQLYGIDLAPPVEIGRQFDESEPLYINKPVKGGQRRFVIARLNEQDISRRHVLIEPVITGRVRITNLSQNRPIHVENHGSLRPRSAPAEYSVPLVLMVGEKAIRIEQLEADATPLSSLALATRAPGLHDSSLSDFTSLPLASATASEMEDVVKWLGIAMDVLQSAANSSDFFDKAARAAVDLVKLDTAQVLRLENDSWRPVAWHTSARIGPAPSRSPSSRILGRVREEKRTFWQVQSMTARDEASLSGVQAVVAAPILDRRGHVIAALYGDRQSQSGAKVTAPISRLEAMLVDLLAVGVAAGLARLEQEQALIRLEQFFPPELARRLATQPELLQGRDAEVTLLFCDIRGFSRITGQLGPAKTVEWIGSIMEMVSDCVLAQGGVVVDYIGDEVMAMWGMPERRPDHARLTCLAALAMLDQLPKLNERWEPILGEPTGLGVGINSGMARVGNTGSQRKLKYGPLGSTVNLASRVQGATKYLKVKVLATGATQAQLDATFETRRLCKVRVVNMPDPVDLYELRPADHPDWLALKEQYQEALAEFEAREFRKAARILGNLLHNFPDDGPSLVLLSRAVNLLVQAKEGADIIWDLPGK